MDDVLRRADPAKAKPDALELLDRWVSHGYISATQAELIRDAEALDGLPRQRRPEEPHPSEHATSLVLEALGYLGGVLMVVASGLLVAQFWADLALAVRIALPAAVALVLLAAGLAVPRSLGRQGSRVRSVLSVAAATALAFSLALAGEEWFEWSGESTAALVGSGFTAVVGTLWWREHTAVLQVGLLAGVVVTTLALLGRFLELDAPLLGLAVWTIGLLWWGLGARELMTPASTARVIGPVAMVVGTLMESMADWGIVLGLVTIATFVVVAVRVRDLWLLVVAAVGALNLVPRVVEEWFPGRLAAPVILLLTGLGMLLAAVRIGRRPTGAQARERRGS